MNQIAKINPSAVTPITFAEAFLKLQAAIKPAIKDATNPAFRSKYADLGAVWEAVKVPLTDNGFSIIQSPNFDGEGMWLETMILHISGEKMTGRYPLKPTKQDPQGFGSALTYARRYSISAMLGVIADDDDDGNAASAPARNGNGAVTTPQPTQAQVIHREDPDVTAGVLNFCNDMKKAIDICKTVEAVTDWEDTNKPMLDRLKKKALASWSDLMRYKENKIGNINLESTK